MDKLRCGIKICMSDYGIRLSALIKIVKDIYFELKHKEEMELWQ